MTDLDIVMVLPGASSLGAYQAGACAGILAGRNALVRLGADVRIPSIGGASAGATVALLAGHALTHSIDPVSFLRDAWVERVDIDLLAVGREAPLGSEGLRSELSDLLLTASERFAQVEPVDPVDVAIHIGLTSLRGYRYTLANLGRRPVSAVSYADWAAVRLPAGGDPAVLVEEDGASALDLVVASTANPFAFPPRLLKRSAAIDPRRRDERSLSAPTDEMWFTDGGLVQSRPIRRTLDLVDEPAARTHVAVIDPRSEGPSSGDPWAGEGRPDWRSALQRSLAIFPAQVLSDELAELDTESQRRTALRQLSDYLTIADRDGYEQWLARNGLTGGLALAGALEWAAGVQHSHPVTADVIHPMLAGDRESVERLLAGEIIGDFGGFLARDLRAHDFALGYASAREWWESSVRDFGLEPLASSLMRALEDERPPAPPDRGDAGLSNLSIRARTRVGKILVRTLRALLRP